MSWVKLDDGCADHAKQLAAGPIACWLWVCGLAYCNRQKARDGVIPKEKVRVLFPLPSPMVHARRLVAVGLWEEVAGGFRVHDYHEFQPVSDDLREKRAAAGRRGGQQSAQAKAKQTGSKTQANAKQSEANARVRVRDTLFASSSLSENKNPETDAARAREGDFDRWWAAYPAKVGKAYARTLWRRREEEGRLPPLDVLLTAVERQRGSDRWQRGVVPNPSTWLNQERWDDELPEPARWSPRTRGNLTALQRFVARGAEDVA